MAKCTCSDAEAECKCGCGCICIDDDSIPVQDRCLAACFKCPDPKDSVAASLSGVVLGMEAHIGSRRRRRGKLSGSTRITIHCKDAPLGSLAMLFERFTGAKIAVPIESLGKKRSLELKGTVDGLAKKLGLVNLAARPRAGR